MNGNLPIFLDPLRNFSQFQTQWAKFINPILGNPIVDGIILQNQILISGDNVINHGLQRNLIGYIPIGQSAAANFYQKISSMPELTLILNSSANVTVSLYVF